MTGGVALTHRNGGSICSGVFTIIAEIGVNMDQFPSAEHISSWAGVAPGNHESAGKKKYEKHEGQQPHQSSLMRSGLGNRSLPKYRTIHKVLENRI